MSDIILTLVVAISVACMYLAQRKSMTPANRHLYSLLGSAASVLVAVEATRRELPNVALLFAVATLLSLYSLVSELAKPSNPDA